MELFGYCNKDTAVYLSSFLRNEKLWIPMFMRKSTFSYDISNVY